MTKRTPYAVLAKLVEELNEENENLNTQIKLLAHSMGELTVNNKNLSRENASLVSQRELNNNRIHLLNSMINSMNADRDRFRARFVRIANEMAELLTGDEARKLAVKQ